MNHTLSLLALMLCLSSCRTASVRDDVDEERLRRLLESNEIEVLEWEEGRVDRSPVGYLQSAFGFRPRVGPDDVRNLSYRCTDGDSISLLIIYRYADSLDAIAAQASFDSLLTLPVDRFDDTGYFDFVHYSSYARIGRLVCEFTLYYYNEPDENCMTTTLLPLRKR